MKVWIGLWRPSSKIRKLFEDNFTRNRTYGNYFDSIRVVFKKSHNLCAKVEPNEWNVLELMGADNRIY